MQIPQGKFHPTACMAAWHRYTSCGLQSLEGGGGKRAAKKAKKQLL
ncbi:MAG: hypothetical protein IJW33_00005 [Lentisphaeria bacterium]|nr:hypothetical protein [Lentisphaeria bacterium]